MVQKGATSRSFCSSAQEQGELLRDLSGHLVTAARPLNHTERETFGTFSLLQRWREEGKWPLQRQQKLCCLPLGASPGVSAFGA